jgi:hypothetical protein
MLGISSHVVGRAMQLIYEEIKVTIWEKSYPNDLTTVVEV